MHRDWNFEEYVSALSSLCIPGMGISRSGAEWPKKSLLDITMSPGPPGLLRDAITDAPPPQATTAGKNRLQVAVIIIPGLSRMPGIYRLRVHTPYSSDADLSGTNLPLASLYGIGQCNEQTALHALVNKLFYFLFNKRIRACLLSEITQTLTYRYATSEETGSAIGCASGP